MAREKNQSIKSKLHPRNKNRERYDLKALITSKPELANYIKPTKYGEDSVDFSNARAVKVLNKALLSHNYGIEHWEFPNENLCPPIPGRADYLHHIADLLADYNNGTIPKGDKITCLDIGVGASCIYPIIGVSEYGWNFIGSDIDRKSLKSAQSIVDSNFALKNKIDFILQREPKSIYKGIINREDKIDISICNPPFYSSIEESQKANQRKVKNLTGKKVTNSEHNFAGVAYETICEGGESSFIQKMIRQSKRFSSNCFWFSTLVSKHTNLPGIYKSLENVEASSIKTIAKGTGNKSSRIVAWTFLSHKEQKEWRDSRWKANKVK